MVEIDGNSLTIEQVQQVARGRSLAAISAGARLRVNESRAIVDRLAGQDQPVYGINTGFGVFADRRIAAGEIQRLNRNLILSHATGTGEALPEEAVRAAMLIRVNTLAKGYSGIRLEVIQTLVEMLNRGVIPVVPSQGSLGSSGDLGPLSFLGLVLSTDAADRDEDSGWAAFEGEVLSGKAAMARAGIPRIVLGAKEGLALNNGAAFSAALASLALWDAGILLDTADVTVSLSLEASLGSSAAFDPRIQEVRGYPGQILAARRILSILRGSTLIDSSGRVQDAYSLRCAPQVHGAVRDAAGFVRGIVEREINAATDNPLIFPDGAALSGGNFHGEPTGLAMDTLGIAVAELAAISERRIFRLTDSRLNAGLPPMLVDRAEDAGLNSGMMMPQYLAASLVLENRTLATPDSIHSLPTSAAQEDHNANSMTAARHAAQIVANSAHVLAIEAYAASRAIDIRLRQSKHARLGAGSQAAWDAIRAEVPYRGPDQWWNPEIEKTCALVRAGSLALPGYPA